MPPKRRRTEPKERDDFEYAADELIAGLMDYTTTGYLIEHVKFMQQEIQRAQESADYYRSRKEYYKSRSEEMGDEIMAAVLSINKARNFIKDRMKEGDEDQCTNRDLLCALDDARTSLDLEL